MGHVRPSTPGADLGGANPGQRRGGEVPLARRQFTPSRGISGQRRARDQCFDVLCRLQLETRSKRFAVAGKAASVLSERSLSEREATEPVLQPTRANPASHCTFQLLYLRPIRLPVALLSAAKSAPWFA